MTQGDSEQLASLLRTGAGRVHMIGVCGIGMAGVARLLKSRGFDVDGCDSHPGKIADWLGTSGIAVSTEHSPAHLNEPALFAVRTSAVANDSPECLAATQAGIPVFRRGEVLAALLQDEHSVAVCGTHGKTTTSTFITHMLRTAGRDPSWCIGGENPALGGVAGSGQNHLLVIEADESDGTLALYKTDIAVVTNIDFDHMEHFADVADFENCFRTFVSAAKQRVIFGADDPRAAAICGDMPKTLSFGLSEKAAVRAVDVALSPQSSSFNLVCADVPLGRVDLPVPGEHNILNALAAAAVGIEFNLPFEAIHQALSSVTLPRRRFDIMADRHDIRVISDYAHHPAEIAAFVRSAKALPHSRLVSVFQPHRYTRTLALGRDFPPAFDDLNPLVLLPVYAASEEPLAGGTSHDLYMHFREHKTRPRGSTGFDFALASSLDQAWAFLRRTLRPGDRLLVIGAGDVEAIAHRAAEWLGTVDTVPAPETLPPAIGASRVTFNEPMSRHNSFRIGGTADAWIELDSRADLQESLRTAREQNLPWRIIGAGTNVLVSDLGLRGLTLRLAGGEFQKIERDGNLVRVGAGVTLSRLVAWAESQASGGFEFLEGIPGTVGGALRMNAGAWNNAIGSLVESVSLVEPDGTASDVAAADCRFSYRSAPGIAGTIITSAVLHTGESTPPDEIREKRCAIREKRAWWRGLRCAGSVFRNPPGRFAGQLIEEAGLKGRTVGGATVSSRHANVIVTRDGALASDVESLVQTIQRAVQATSGVLLEPEIVRFD